MFTAHHRECSRQTRQGTRDEERLQQLFYRHSCSLGRNSKQASSGRLRTPSSKKITNIYLLKNRLIAPAQHTSSSTDSAGHVDTSGIIICDPLVPRVLTAPLQLDSNLLVTLEVALMVPLTCLTRHFLCTHHWPASHSSKKGAPNFRSRPPPPPPSIQAQNDGFT